MALNLPANIPNFNITPQPPIDYLGNAGKMLQLKNMLGEQQLLPGRLQQQQQELQTGQLGQEEQHLKIQQEQINLKNEQSGAAWLSELGQPGETAPAVPAGGVSPATGTRSPGTAEVPPKPAPHLFSGSPEDTYNRVFAGYVNHGATIQYAHQQAAGFLKMKQDTEAATKTQLDNWATSNKKLASELIGLKDLEPEDQEAGLGKIKSEASSLPLSPDDQGIYDSLQYTGPDKFPTHLDAAINLVGHHDALIDATSKNLDILTKDPVFKLSQPDELAKPGAVAAIQARIEDPKTPDADIHRLELLIPKAKVAQDAVVNLEQRKKLAEQVVTQGSTDDAGKLLANRTLTYDELKARGSTPDFLVKATEAAIKYDPMFKAAEAAAQGAIAKAPINQQFFGNTDSLLVKSGTLDQLGRNADALPTGQIPKWNKVENMVSAALGKGSTAKFAASALGVADDYAKVMGVGSDTARTQVMDQLGAAQSKEQLHAVIDQYREQINSQREGRIGSNPYLTDMYPRPTQSAEPKKPTITAPAGKTTVFSPKGEAHFVDSDKVAELLGDPKYKGWTK